MKTKIKTMSQKEEDLSEEKVEEIEESQIAFKILLLKERNLIM